MVLREMLDQAWRPRPQPSNPIELFGPGMRRCEQTIRRLRKRDTVMRLGHRKAADQHAPDPVGPLRVFVLPGVWLPATGGQDFDVVPFADFLREQAAGMFG